MSDVAGAAGAFWLGLQCSERVCLMRAAVTPRGPAGGLCWWEWHVSFRAADRKRTRVPSRRGGWAGGFLATSLEVPMARNVDPAPQNRWCMLLRLQPQSGLTIAKNWLRHDCSTAAFYAWRRRLAVQPGTVATTASLSVT
ncbi:MAG: hypothetical protein EA381_13630 [Planctomycetaceae bacterium]|nr:MAG: hypothetical protein EA381_13630 [Planctomycetaceae bacterium]